MAFHDDRFPITISTNSQGGPGYNNKILELASGHDVVVQRWSSFKKTFDVALGIRSLEDLSTVATFFIARNGAANSFPYRDPMDYSSNVMGHLAPGLEDQELGVGDGTTTVFQLVKRYTSGVQTQTVPITKPITDTVRVWADGVELLTGWTVSRATGQVTFAVAPNVGVILTASYEFDEVVRFGKDVDLSLPLRITGFEDGSIESIPLIGVKDASQPNVQDIPSGGASSYLIDDDIELDTGMGMVITLSASTTGLKAILPDPATIPSGGPIMILHVVGSNAINLVTHTDAAVLTMNTSTATMVLLTVDGAAAKVWVGV